MSGKRAQEMAMVTEELKELIHRCILFTDRNGEVLCKESTPITVRLRTKYMGNGLYIRFGVAVSCMSVGSYWMDVHTGKEGQSLSCWELVLEAEENVQCYYGAVAKHPN